MRKQTLPLVVSMVLLASVALAACGGKGTVKGTVVARPGSPATLTIEGKATTTLSLECAGPQPVTMLDRGEAKQLEVGTSVRLTFEGARTLEFRNDGEMPTRIRYEATSAGGISSSLVQ
jgi:predicted small secreted protein